RLHGEAGAAGRQVRTVQDQLPALAAVGAAIQAAFGGVAPQLAGHAGEYGVGGARVDEDLGDALARGQADVLPGLTAVTGLVDAVPDRDAVARPGFAGADPDVLRVRGVDGDRADRLHRLLIEHRLEGRGAVGRLPHPA